MEEQLSCNNDKHCKTKRLIGDRLSLLPDAILIEILSLLSIKTAASTSVLSRRWRYLWTGVTSFIYDDPRGEFTSFVYRILSQLTSPIIRKFVVIVDNTWGVSPGRDLPSELDCFLFLCSRNVEEIMICRFPKDTNIGLPNLKKLRLYFGLASFGPIATLFRTCPLLEDLHLAFDALENQNVVKIFAPNLKSLLYIKMMHPDEQNNIIIDTPKLVDLTALDCSSLYCIVQIPIQLSTAHIDFTHLEELREDEGVDADVYLRKIAKFLLRLSSVRNLLLKSMMKLFTYFDSVFYGAMLIFYNLSHFKTTLNSDYSGKDFLLSLQCAPNLKDLEVIVEGKHMVDLRNWCAPDCSLSKLKMIKVQGLEGNGDDVKLLEYILKNSVVLKELRVELCTKFKLKDKVAQVGKEYKFCDTLLNLQRSSLTSKVVFSGEYISATSNAIKGGLLNGQIRFFN